MNELDLTNAQAVIFMMILIGLLLYLKPPRPPKKTPKFERESKQAIETPSEDLNPDYGRYIQLAGVNVWGGIE